MKARALEALRRVANAWSRVPWLVLAAGLNVGLCFLLPRGTYPPWLSIGLAVLICALSWVSLRRARARRDKSLRDLVAIAVYRVRELEEENAALRLRVHSMDSGEATKPSTYETPN